jgi:hypothetical protein
VGAIDHWIWAVPDLESGSEDIRRRVGKGYFGGRHEELGSANHVVPLEGDCYLEVLGPSDQPGPYRAALRGCEPRLVTFAVGEHDLERISKLARHIGLSTSGPYEGTRLQTDGTRLRWRTLELRGHVFGNYLPFFIDWQNSPHPSSFLSAEAAVESFVIQHTEHELATLYEALAIPVEVRSGPDRMSLTLRTRGGLEVLEGYGRFTLLESRD